MAERMASSPGAVEAPGACARGEGEAVTVEEIAVAAAASDVGELLLRRTMDSWACHTDWQTLSRLAASRSTDDDDLPGWADFREQVERDAREQVLELCRHSAGALSFGASRLDATFYAPPHPHYVALYAAALAVQEPLPQPETSVTAAADGSPIVVNVSPPNVSVTNQVPVPEVTVEAPDVQVTVEGPERPEALRVVRDRDGNVTGVEID